MSISEIQKHLEGRPDGPGDTDETTRVARVVPLSTYDPEAKADAYLGGVRHAESPACEDRYFTHYFRVRDPKQARVARALSGVPTGA